MTKSNINVKMKSIKIRIYVNENVMEAASLKEIRNYTVHVK